MMLEISNGAIKPIIAFITKINGITTSKQSSVIGRYHQRYVRED